MVNKEVNTGSTGRIEAITRSNIRGIHSSIQGNRHLHGGITGINTYPYRGIHTVYKAHTRRQVGIYGAIHKDIASPTGNKGVYKQQGITNSYGADDYSVIVSKILSLIHISPIGYILVSKYTYRHQESSSAP